ncbi:flagellar basal body-associated protein FliL [Anaerobacterium chartisolvens]|uniref:Flagellar protein FliL n=1 Tax=Anaerobacterium chartisolvens TaxID=1297424 RepID=A0A369B278_9FIRM|nr:flagellar basal body-associated FliL family protein [Anaerobacterium chartisolvens]RCX15521.1 flagellar basal body-associated protein FliL [Anaerobacterium chartisolvens]
MEGKGSLFNIILLIIIAFLTLTLAALAGYVVLGGGSKDSGAVASNIDTSIPSDDDLDMFSLYEGKTYLNLKATDDKTVPVIQIGLQLKHYKKTPKGSSIKDPLAKIELYQNEIKQIAGTYFMGLTSQDVRDSDAKKKAAEDLKNSINDLLNKNEQNKYPIVYDIIFSEWFCT